MDCELEILDDMEDGEVVSVVAESWNEKSGTENDIRFGTINDFMAVKAGKCRRWAIYGFVDQVKGQGTCIERHLAVCDMCDVSKTVGEADESEKEKKGKYNCWQEKYKKGGGGEPEYEER